MTDFTNDKDAPFCSPTQFKGPEFARRAHVLTRYEYAAVGAACCERMLRNYQRFAAEVGTLNMQPVRAELNLVWSYALAGRPRRIETDELEAACTACVPDLSLYFGPVRGNPKLSPRCFVV